MTRSLPIVFLGPSLPVDDARQILDADYRPPVRRGDLPAAHSAPVVIVDGEFGQSLSVSPNEILRLLDSGITVVGASSMGALRAAELHRYGMTGYGWIFEQYLAGRIIGDDEVALAYSPFDLRPVTVPLVNVRYWLARLKAAGAIDTATSRRLFSAARRLFYADRTEPRLRSAIEAVVGADQTRRLLAVFDGIPDIKAEDARTALRALSR